MYSRKSLGQRMDPWGTPALTGYSCEEFPSRTTWRRLEELEEGDLNKTSMPKSVKDLGYIKCYSSSRPRPVKNSCNSIRHNCQMICNWSRRPKSILEIREKARFLWVIDNLIIYKFSKDFTNHRNKINRLVVFSSRSFSNILKGCVCYIFASLFLSLNESTCQTRKNGFYFTWEALFVLEKIKF